VEGLTLHQAQALIAQKLMSAGMYREPQVSDSVRSSPNQTAPSLESCTELWRSRGETALHVLAAVSAAAGFSSTATTVVVGGGGLPLRRVILFDHRPAWRSLS